MLRPVHFGRQSSDIWSVELGAGVVTLSSTQLSIAPPSIRADTVMYSNVAPATDLSYRTSPSGVVEDLVLNSSSAPTVFHFHLSDPNRTLGAAKSQGGGVRFSSVIDGDAILGLAAPFAYQGSSGPSATDAPPVIDPHSAHMSVTRSGDGWDIAESVDPGWLKNKRFPIVLDPTLTFNHAGGTMLAGSDIDFPNSCGSTCVVNTTSSDLGTGTYTDSQVNEEPARSVFRFDVSSIPGGSTVSSATFNADTVGCVGNPNGGTYYCNQNNYTVELHPMDSAWSTSSTFSQIAAQTDSSVFSSLYQPSFSASYYPPCTGCFWESFNVTSQAQSWVNSEATNFGFLAKLQNEAYSIGGPFWSYLGPYGGGNGWPPPYLQVTFTPNSPAGGELLGGSNPAEPGVVQCSATQYPVDCGTGDLFHAQSDLSIPGRGLPLALERTYNSLNASTNGPFGYGWSSSYAMALTTDSSGDATITQENGSQVSFTNTNGSLIPPPRVTATLTKNSDGSYTFVRAARERFSFSAAGLLESETDLNGYTTTIAYSGSAVHTVTDPAGRTLTFSYGANGDVASVSDSGGRSVSYAYDSSGNLSSATDADGHATSFTYDPSHLLLTMTDPRGGVTTNTYDSSGRILTQSDPMHRTTSFSYEANSTTITDPLGNIEVQSYNYGLLASLTRASGTSEAATWLYHHGTPTLAVTETTDPNGNVTVASYDGQNNLLSETDALGNQSLYGYDSLDDLLSQTDPMGHSVSMTYDASGNLLSSSRTMTETGQALTTSYTYGDAYPGDVTSVTEPDRSIWKFSYDSMGDLVSAADPLGDETTYVFDGLGRALTRVSPRGNAPAGNPAEYTTTYSYDARSQLLRVVNPLGNPTTYIYDANGNITSSTDSVGNLTSTTYDADNEVISSLAGDGATTAYGHDADGNVITVTDGNGHMTSYGYDALNRVQTVTDALGRTTSYSHDGVGNLLTATNASGQVMTYGYDADNRRTSVTPSDPATSAFTYTYNPDGQVTDEEGADISRQYSYDSLNRLSSTEEVATVEPAPGATPQVRRTIAYGYDLMGRVTALSLGTNPAGGDALITRDFARTYNQAGEMTSVADGLGDTTLFQYDADANLTTETYPNSTLASFSYDAADQMISVLDTNAAGAPFLSLCYTRSPNGLVATTNSSCTAAGPTATYSYDGSSRLTSAGLAGGAPPTTYGYDLADNLTSVTSPAGMTRSLSYDSADELLAAKDAATGRSVSFSYNLQGDRTSETDSLGNQVNFGFNQADQLASYKGPVLSDIGQKVATPSQSYYLYDGSGLRTDLSWDLSGPMPLVVGTLDTTAYLTGPNGLPVERIDAAGNALYFHQDQLGSTRALTGAAGVVVATYSYGDYGQSIASGTAVANPFLFAGQYTDPLSGLLYMRARWYDPTTGQFLSVDSAAKATHEPYSYAEDDPVNLSDPTGQCAAELPRSASFLRNKFCDSVVVHWLLSWVGYRGLIDAGVALLSGHPKSQDLLKNVASNGNEAAATQTLLALAEKYGISVLRIAGKAGGLIGGVIATVIDYSCHVTKPPQLEPGPFNGSPGTYGSQPVLYA